MDVALFGAPGIMFAPHGIADLIQPFLGAVLHFSIDLAANPPYTANRQRHRYRRMIPSFRVSYDKDGIELIVQAALRFV
jgi:hypothetical protein